MKRRKRTRIAKISAPPSRPDPIPGLATGHDLLAILRPYVRHCGDSHRPAWSIGPRRLLDYLLVYIADGHGRFVIAGQSYAAAPGDLFWIPPDTLHSMQGDAPGMHCPYVHFDLVYRPTHSHWDFSIPEGMEDLGELRSLLPEPLPHPLLQQLPGRICTHTNRHVGSLIQEICAEASRARPFAGVRMSGLLLQIVAEILRGRAGLPADERAHLPALEHAADQMSRQCHEPLRLSTIAKSCALSPSHFRSLFQRHVGQTPRAYLRQARLCRARELMINTSLSLSEIAGKTGFATVHSFSRAFHALEGMAPRDYRKYAGTIHTRVEGRRTPYSQ